jgi:hypothetical protein
MKSRNRTVQKKSSICVYSPRVQLGLTAVFSIISSAFSSILFSIFSFAFLPHSPPYSPLYFSPYSPYFPPLDARRVFLYFCSPSLYGFRTGYLYPADCSFVHSSAGSFSIHFCCLYPGLLSFFLQLLFLAFRASGLLKEGEGEREVVDSGRYKCEYLFTLVVLSLQVYGAHSIPCRL